MKLVRRLQFVLALLPCVITLTAPGLEAQKPASAAASSLILRGMDGRTHKVTAEEFAKFARVDTTVSAHHVSGRYSGVALSDLLTLVHAPSGDSLRGNALATYVVIIGADGYRAVLALAEADAGFTDRLVFVADRKDGEALPAAEGPYHLIITGEKRPARWVRQTIRIELRNAAP